MRKTVGLEPRTLSKYGHRGGADLPPRPGGGLGERGPIRRGGLRIRGFRAAPGREDARQLRSHVVSIARRLQIRRCRGICAWPETNPESCYMSSLEVEG